MIVRVMTYNVCHYDFDRGLGGFPPDIMDDKAAALKELLMSTAPGLIGLQEDYKYADDAHTLKSSAYLYKPVWSFCPEGNGCTIRSKLNFISGSNGKVLFSTGRHFRKAAFKVDGRRMLFISCHPTAKVGHSEEREKEYTELFDYVQKEPWDWCVIAGDFNTTEQRDKDNLTALCAENGFEMAIGTYLPWVSTYPGHDGTAKKSFDNILANGRTGRASILTTAALRDWFPRLYSDHVPVIADIILE